jgi:hypothetical protein
MQRKTVRKKLALNKYTVADLDRQGLERIKAGQVVFEIPGIDIPTFNDYSCWWGGTCDSGRCSEDGGCGGTSACTV